MPGTPTLSLVQGALADRVEPEAARQTFSLGLCLQPLWFLNKQSQI
jgi:hypothetical protein